MLPVNQSRRPCTLVFKEIVWGTRWSTSSLLLEARKQIVSSAGWRKVVVAAKWEVKGTLNPSSSYAHLLQSASPNKWTTLGMAAGNRLMNIAFPSSNNLIREPLKKTFWLLCTPNHARVGSLLYIWANRTGAGWGLESQWVQLSGLA